MAGTNRLDRDEYRQFFRSLTGNEAFDYQVRVAETLWAGRNVILRAPTGAGKTWASVAPYLWERVSGEGFHDRCIYALPLRTLATSLHETILNACGVDFNGFTVRREEVTLRDYANPRVLYITIQTGELRSDPFFEGDLVFTTIDQLLSSYLMMPVSLPEKLGNINAGALPGALMVFDEFHLLEPLRAMGTVLEMADRLSPFSQFLIMTATMSTESVALLAEDLQAEIITLGQTEVEALPSQQDKRRTFKWVSRPLTAEAVWEGHEGNRTIVIVNTVSRAQQLYEKLKEYVRGFPTTLLLLHSRFYPQDRAAKEGLLSTFFGKDSTSSDVILVTTQVVEAGMDISADILHTELAPMNSLIQRSGRCARYAGARGIGTVVVYELEKTDKGERKWGPYRETPVRQISDVTRTVLENLQPEGVLVKAEMEAEWINLVHGSVERAALEAFNMFQRRRMVNEAMEGQRKEAVSTLVRDIFSVSVVITDSPEDLSFDRRMWPRAVSVPRVSLFSLSGYFSSGVRLPWVAKVPRRPDEEEDESLRFRWVEATRVQDVVYAPWLVVLHPSVCAYSTEVGLQLGVRSTDDVSVEYDIQAPIPSYRMRFETYRTHVAGVLGKGREMLGRYWNALAAVEKTAHLEKGDTVRLVDLACALHDVGKLSRKWQEAMCKWQASKAISKLGSEAIAHTDYDPETDWERQKAFPPRGPHAMEGAFAVGKWLLDAGLREEVAATVWTAIARHHGVHTHELSGFRFIDGAEEIVRSALPDHGRVGVTLENGPDKVCRRRFREDLLCFTRGGDATMWALYVVLVRILRLSDQKSMQ
jgi:CRISPR-associated endonuclease/helicase Cas3